jgi:RND family efflux transporter MFP subunit
MSEVSGKIIRINRDIGDAVDTKDIIAVIDDNVPRSNYEHAKAQVLSAETNLKIARLNLQSDEELFNNGDISDLEYQNSLLAVKTAEANYQSATASLSRLEKTYNDTRIISPIKGLISRKYVDTGTMVTNNMPVYRVVDLSTLKLRAGVPQEIISRVKRNNQADITISGLNNRRFTGFVHSISPQADEQTGAFMVEIHIKNTPDHQIKAGMTAKVDLMVREDTNRLVIPDYAVVMKNGNNYLYRLNNGRAYLTQLIAGETIGGHIVVLEGVADGDTIAVVGMKNLGVETPVVIEILHE